MKIMKSKKIVILTGAGISAESGIDTFRDAGGLWENHRVEDVATPEGFAEDPELVHRFYNLRRAALKTVEPNAAHIALAKLEAGLAKQGGQLTLVTQNVDDLHERGGVSEVMGISGGRLPKNGLSEMPCQRRVPTRHRLVWRNALRYACH